MGQKVHCRGGSFSSAPGNCRIGGEFLAEIDALDALGFVAILRGEGPHGDAGVIPIEHIGPALRDGAAGGSLCEIVKLVEELLRPLLLRGRR